MLNRGPLGEPRCGCVHTPTRNPFIHTTRSCSFTMIRFTNPPMMMTPTRGRAEAKGPPRPRYARRVGRLI